MNAERTVVRVVPALLVMTIIGLVFGQRGLAQPRTFERGDHVRSAFKNVPVLVPPGAPAQAVPRNPDLVLTVVAVPGDHVRIADSTLYVNDVPVRGFSPQFMAIVTAYPERVREFLPDGVVPPNWYFTMGEGTRSDGQPDWSYGTVIGSSLETAP